MHLEPKPFSAVLVFIFSLLLDVNALIPTVCTQNATRFRSGVCCPNNQQNGQVCGGPLRGDCRRINVFQYDVPPNIRNDDRFMWPERFFNYTCHCFSNFFGPSCEDCWYGWGGEKCDQPEKLKIRRDIRSYSSKDKQLLVDLLLKARDYPSDYSVLIESDNRYSDPIKPNPIWQPANIMYYLAAMHRYASRSTLFYDTDTCQQLGVLDFNHNGLAFLLWHRYFILTWEKYLQKLAEQFYGIRNFTFPFWDWTNKDECEVCTNDLVGAPGEIDEWGQRLHYDSPFRGATEYCRLPVEKTVLCFGCNYEKQFGPITRMWENGTQFPRKDAVDYVLSIPNFFHEEELNVTNGCLSFHTALEGFCGEHSSGNTSGTAFMHNYVHNSVLGSFCCSGTSVSDPLFPLHHTQIDRILQTWFHRYRPNITQLPLVSLQFGQCRYCSVTAFFPVINYRMLFYDTRHFGYIYEHFNYGDEYDDIPPEHFFNVGKNEVINSFIAQIWDTTKAIFNKLVM